ncbi:sigma-70 family RNA polymerase sigma factor [Candidatus Woesearchaeota archaeon]|nr:sigma-70 family RNA polymerase sigma factor [Candidatus Woesearchaeota archaeon]
MGVEEKVEAAVIEDSGAEDLYSKEDTEYSKEDAVVSMNEAYALANSEEEWDSELAELMPTDAGGRVSVMGLYVREACDYPLMTLEEETVVGEQNIREWDTVNLVCKELYRAGRSCAAGTVSVYRISRAEEEERYATLSALDSLAEKIEEIDGDVTDAMQGIISISELADLVQTVKPRDYIVSRILRKLNKQYNHEFSHYAPHLTEGPAPRAKDPEPPEKEPGYIALLRALADTRKTSEAMREEMIRANLRLVICFAKKYQNKGLPLLDLVQEGNIGALRAVQTYDSRFNTRFSTYAVWWVRQCINRAIIEKSKNVRVPVHTHDRHVTISKVKKEFCNAYGRDPTVDEIYDRTGFHPESIREVEERMRVSETVAYDDPGKDGHPLIEALGDRKRTLPEDRIEVKELSAAIENAVADLTPRQVDVLRMRFGLQRKRVNGEPVSGIDMLVAKNPDGMTLREVGDFFSLTRERIRQIEEKALERLRHPKRSNALKPFADNLQ